MPSQPQKVIHSKSARRGHLTRKETARHLMIVDVPWFDAARSVEHVRESFKTRKYAFADSVYVIDQHGRLAGELPVARLLASASSVPIAQIADPPTVTIPPDMDQELVAAAAHRSRSAAVPVACSQGTDPPLE